MVYRERGETDKQTQTQRQRERQRGRERERETKKREARWLGIDIKFNIIPELRALKNWQGRGERFPKRQHNTHLWVRSATRWCPSKKRRLSLCVSLQAHPTRALHGHLSPSDKMVREFLILDTSTSSSEFRPLKKDLGSPIPADMLLAPMHPFPGYASPIFKMNESPLPQTPPPIPPPLRNRKTWKYSSVQEDKNRAFRVAAQWDTLLIRSQCAEPRGAGDGSVFLFLWSLFQIL